jgi:hypothetical protein
MSRHNRERRRGGRGPMPAIPARVLDDAERLRHARSAIVPWQVYRMALPGGGVLEVSGAELIREADRMVALIDAHRAGDEAGLERAVRRIFEEP